jgi:hypothetical protein
MTNLNPGLRPRRRFNPWLLVPIILAAFAVFGVALFLILRSALGPVVTAGDAFMGALRDGNYAQAYAEAAPDLQQALGGAERLSGTAPTYRPSSWSWSQRSVRNGTGYLSGTVTYRAGNGGTAELRLAKVDGQWRVSAFRLN